MDQPHDDSDTIAGHLGPGDDDSSAAYDAERAAQDASDNEMAERCYQEELAERRAINDPQIQHAARVEIERRSSADSFYAGKAFERQQQRDALGDDEHGRKSW